jgi:hypothetical protein
MSNVKLIKIQGDLDTLALMAAPDSVTELGCETMMLGHNIQENHVSEALEAAKRVKEFLAMSTIPHFGLKVYFEDAPARSEKNGYGGQTKYFNYTIQGTEAVRWEWFESLIRALSVFGKVKLRACKDLE